MSNVYNETVVNNVNVNRTSFNGGPGGLQTQPSAADRAAATMPHVQPAAAQLHNEQAARINRGQYSSANQGTPRVAATARPGEFSGPGVVQPRTMMGGASSANGVPGGAGRRGPSVPNYTGNSPAHGATPPVGARTQSYGPGQAVPVPQSNSRMSQGGGARSPAMTVHPPYSQTPQGPGTRPPGVTTTPTYSGRSAPGSGGPHSTNAPAAPRAQGAPRPPPGNGEGH